MADETTPPEELAEGELNATENEELEEVPTAEVVDTVEGKFDNLLKQEEGKVIRVTGMFKDWFLDYASYVILERAVPHINDGLKPVQRRILHAMQKLDDGRFNKVANIIGFTMQFHPHGDASIGAALVGLGQKELLIETQGNFGNILTGDGAAAPRYIEARLSKFAIEVAFNPKTTNWISSYDGRNKEPVALPMKFPLLLAQGVEGIAVGLASKVLPHNFIELIDASIAHLKGERFEILPDFPTGGLADTTHYNDGARGGRVKVRAKIGKIDNKTLAITEIPFGLDTSKLIDSIVKANEKGKIKIKKVDDNTARNVEILIHLPADVSPDITIDALYAFTDCELSIACYACVIREEKPCFIGVSEILRTNTEETKELLRQELLIRLAELEEDWHYSSLEKIFFEQRIYRELEKDVITWEKQLESIDTAFDPYKSMLKRDITMDDISKLTEKPVRRISKFDIKKADEHILGVEKEIELVKSNLAELTAYAIAYFNRIKKKYSAGRERKTELQSFDSITATQVVVANEKLYVNLKEGFVGYDLKRDEDAQYVCDCSDIDEIIVFFKNGKYMVCKVSEKAFVGKDILYVNVFRKNDTRTIYNILFRDGSNGNIQVKRTSVTGTQRDKLYDITKGTENSMILYFSANPNGEAEVLKVYFKPKPKLRKLIEELDFATVSIKGKSSMGVFFAKTAIHKIVIKEKGISTLGGLKVWLDEVTFRLNNDERGKYIGEFYGDDKILVINNKAQYFTTNYDLVNRYDADMSLIQKFDPKKIFTAVYYDAEQLFYYLKRFTFETAVNPELFIDEHPKSYLVALSEDEYPQIEITFGGKHAKRPNEIIDVEQFIAVKTSRAKGKRLTAYEVDKIEFIEPLQREIVEEEPQGPPDLPKEIEDTSDATQMSLL